jgi:hypothetical protein
MGDERVQNNGKRSNERVRPEAWQIKFPKEFIRRFAAAPVPPAARRKILFPPPQELCTLRRATLDYPTQEIP